MEMNMKPKGISVDRYKEMALAGLTMREAAEVLGVSKTSVQGMASRHGIVFVQGKAGGSREKKE
jgi:excisionase family DNA binding protein